MLKWLKDKSKTLPNDFDCFISKTTWYKYSLWTIVFTGLLAFATNVYAVWRLPLGNTDEAWYTFIIREQQPIPGSSFALYFRMLRNSSILSLRFFELGLRLFAAGVFGSSVYCLFQDRIRKRGILLFLACSVFCYEALFPQYVTVPCYITLEFFWGMLSMSMLFFAFSSNNKAMQFLFSFAGGFFCMQLFFDMATSVPFILLVFIAVCFIGKKHAVSWISGAAIGLVFYFVFIQDPTACLSYFRGMLDSDNVKSELKHSVWIRLVRWSIYTASFFVSRIAFCCIAVCAIIALPEKKKTLKFYLSLVTALGVCFVVLLEVAHSAFRTERTFSIEALYVIFFLAACAYYRMHRFEIRTFAFFILLSFSPVLLCLGTDVPFEIRSLVYAISLIVPVLVLSAGMKNSHLSFMVFILVVILMMRFFLQFNARSWATGEKFFQHTESLSEYGLNVPASPVQAAEVKKVAEITQGIPYFCGTCPCWQHIVILNKKAVSPMFAHAGSDLRGAFAKHGLTKEDVAFLEDRNLPDGGFFDGWSELYRVYFEASETERIPIGESYDIVIFR